MHPSSELNSPPRVLYEDNHLIAVFKPSGLLTQGDYSGAPSLLEWTKEWLREKYDKPGHVFLGLVHRLDRPVCGVVLFAKTSKAASRISEQFRSHTVCKIYYALVQGEPARKERTLTHYLGVSDGHRVCVGLEPREGWKLARLSYRQLERRGPCSLLEVTLETGRKHQIRAQLSAIGHPIVGDHRYGARESWGAGAIALVAQRLQIDHPTRAERMEIVLEGGLNPLQLPGVR